jgi:hypothetical protein
MNKAILFGLAGLALVQPALAQEHERPPSSRETSLLQQERRHRLDLGGASLGLRRTGLSTGLQLGARPAGGVTPFAEIGRSRWQGASGNNFVAVGADFAAGGWGASVSLARGISRRDSAVQVGLGRKF